VRFVGRSRWTDRDHDGPRERRVELEDGRIFWAEEGSMLWEEAERDREPE
jgi:hypothetical protein